MPSQINVQLTGRIGGLIFYKSGEKFYCRTAPGHIRQTKATKTRAAQFGRAARYGKAIRQQLLPVIPFPADNKMQTRLVTAILRWLQSHPTAQPEPCNDVPFVSGFQFTEGYGLNERWHIPLEVSHPLPGLLALKIPAFVPEKDVSAPAKTVRVECRIMAAGFDMETGVATGGFSTSLSFAYNNIEAPEQIISLPLPTAAGSVIITGISLIYYVPQNGHPQPTANKAFMPAGIVNAMYL